MSCSVWLRNTADRQAVASVPEPQQAQHFRGQNQPMRGMPGVRGGLANRGRGGTGELRSPDSWTS